MIYEEFTFEVKKFISEKAGIDSSLIQEDTLIIESGYVDSLILVELIIFIENLTGNSIDIDDFKVSKFSTIKSIYKNYGN